MKILGSSGKKMMLDVESFFKGTPDMVFDNTSLKSIYKQVVNKAFSLNKASSAFLGTKIAFADRIDSFAGIEWDTIYVYFAKDLDSSSIVFKTQVSDDVAYVACLSTSITMSLTTTIDLYRYTGIASSEPQEKYLIGTECSPSLKGHQMLATDLGDVASFIK